jgi:hypothetical protein
LESLFAPFKNTLARALSQEHFSHEANEAVGDFVATCSKPGGRELLVQPQTYPPMKPEEIAEKTSIAVSDLINNHAREIERILDESEGKIRLRFHCTVKDHKMKVGLGFGSSIKDEINFPLDGDQVLLPGLESTKSRRKKQAAAA